MLIYVGQIKAPGAIVVEWNVQQPSGQTGATGMWDSHIRYPRLLFSRGSFFLMFYLFVF